MYVEVAFTARGQLWLSPRNRLACKSGEEDCPYCLNNHFSRSRSVEHEGSGSSPHKGLESARKLSQTVEALGTHDCIPGKPYSDNASSRDLTTQTTYGLEV